MVEDRTLFNICEKKKYILRFSSKFENRPKLVVFGGFSALVPNDETSPMPHYRIGFTPPRDLSNKLSTSKNNASCATVKKTKFKT